MRELMKYALIVVASVPVLMLYPFVQKYFVRGIMLGAIKG
jgi:ABC-type glycerol-3-phosphate transport system permease component